MYNGLYEGIIDVDSQGLRGGATNGLANGNVENERYSPSFNRYAVRYPINLYGFTCTEIPNNTAFTFNNGVTDTPFSVFIWANVHSIPINSYLFSKTNNNNLQSEWNLLYATNGLIIVSLQSVSGATAFIGRLTNAGTLKTGVMSHIGFTYDGSQTSAGIKIYLNKTRVDTTNNNVGAYVGMSNTVAPVRISWDANDLSVVAPVLINKELSQTEINELYEKKWRSLKTVSFANSIVSAWTIKPSDYPNHIDYVAGRNGILLQTSSSSITPLQA